MLKLSQFSLGQLLIGIGIFLSILGIGVTIFSRRRTRETELKSEELPELKILGKSNPVLIADFDVLWPTLLKVNFRTKTRQKAIFKLVRDVRINHSGIARYSEHYEIPYKEKICGSGKFHFMLDPNAKYRLEAESSIEGVDDKGLVNISEIFGKYMDVEKEGNEHVIVTSKTNNGRQSIQIKRLIAMFQSTLYTELRGQKLKDALINNAKNTGHDERFQDWYSRYPTIFDEIADAVCSHSSAKATVIGDIEYNLVRVEKPYEWLFSVGLTLLTIGTVVLLAGLK